MARNYSNIAVDTTLTAGINAAVGSCVVASATGWPAAPFAAVLDPGLVTEEVVEVTVKVGTTFTITRGFDGTAAAAHALGAVVRHAAIASDFTDLQAADTAEAGTRAAADSALNSAISSEATTRASADSALSTAISNEAIARSNADALRLLIANYDWSTLPNKPAFGSLALLNSITASLISDASANGQSLIMAANYAAMRTLLGLVVGTDVQAFDATLTQFAAYNANGLLTQTAPDTFVGRTLAGTANRIAVVNGDGVAGAPTFDISTSYIGQASITTLGTIGAGVWQGTLVAPAFGGTGTNNTGNLAWPSGGGTAALLGTANVFTAQNTVTATSGTGISATATSGTAINASASGGGTAINASSTSSGGGLIADGSGIGHPLRARYNGSNATSIQTIATLENRTSSGGTGTGAALRFAARTSTTADTDAGFINMLFAIGTHASRTARATLTLTDFNATREWLRGETDGTNPMIGFLGALATARVAITGSRAGNAALASLLTELAAKGLITDSSSA